LYVVTPVPVVGLIMRKLSLFYQTLFIANGKIQSFFCGPVLVNRYSALNSKLIRNDVILNTNVSTLWLPAGATYSPRFACSWPLTSSESSSSGGPVFHIESGSDLKTGRSEHPLRNSTTSDRRHTGRTENRGLGAEDRGQRTEYGGRSFLLLSSDFRLPSENFLPPSSVFRLPSGCPL
jgi:hypothetical protein